MEVQMATSIGGGARHDLGASARRRTWQLLRLQQHARRPAAAVLPQHDAGTRQVCVVHRLLPTMTPWSAFGTQQWRQSEA